jgi:hypothetical protein
MSNFYARMVLDCEHGRIEICHATYYMNLSKINLNHYLSM